ncbi:MAG TPA: hypothetical protein VEA19_01730, partial [Actinomycetota bacterium]|nr:hypothetical protein [Actinomycetota bacterium]
VHDLGWGAIGGVIISVGLLAQVRGPERAVAGAQQAALGLLALTGAYVAARDIPALAAPGALVLLAIVIWLHPSRSEILSIGRPSIALLGLTALAAVPLVLYAFDQIGIARADKVSAHARELHWSAMAGMAFAIILTALVASNRSRGARLSAWCTAVALAVYGAGSLLNPDAPSAAAVPWATAAVTWAIAFVATAEWQVRSEGAR